FHTVYLHGLMRHKDGSKISKSNPQPGDNPLDVIQDYSADALRFTIITSSAPGNDTKLDLEKVEHARNFGNKIWNMARFITSNLKAGEPISPITNLQSLSLVDRWILSRLHRVIASVNENFERWEFGEGTRQVHDFLWSEFADWYIEASKIALYGNDVNAQRRTRSILLYTLDQSLRLLHPTMPFVTEEAWQQLRAFGMPSQYDALMVADWPQPNKMFFDARAEKDFALVMEIIRAIRNARAEFNVEAGKRIPAIISAGAARALIESQRDIITQLARLDPDALHIEKRATKPAQALALVVGKIEIYLPLAGMIDLEKEKARLAKEIAQTRADIERAEKLLASEFSKKAPPEVVQKQRDALAANRERAARLEVQLASLEGRQVAPTPKRVTTRRAKRRARR
ncbi:MAG: class I tRNA ligase family protein, partial [Anaerolineae bacterium]|nr:class I tRNA ligase family protein [Anaerolineae bacterium]